MLTISWLFLVGSLIAAIASALKPGVPLWIAVVLLWVVVALQIIPVR